MSNNFSIQQFEILLKLYKSSFLNFDSFENSHKVMTKEITSGLNISRASIWGFEKDKLKSKILYDSKSESFIKQPDLLKSDIPNYFDAVQKGVSIIANDAQQNSLTKDLAVAYLIPLNIKSILNLPIWENGKLTGILCCEHTSNKEWSENDILFAQSVIDFFMLLLEENKKRIAEKKLLDGEDRFKFISENISDGIYIIENNVLVFASATYLKMIDLSEEEKRNSHSIDMFELTHPDDKKRVIDCIYGAANKKISSTKYVFRCRKKNGEYMWREDIMNIQYDASGHAFRAVTIARDITQEKEKELEIINKQKAIDLQNKLLIKLYANTIDLSIKEKINYITIIAAEGLTIDRASYWEIEGNQLVCKNLFDKIKNIHTNNQKLNIRELPKYIEAIKNQTAIIADDVLTNDATSELVDNYLIPSGITDMLDIPVRENGKLYGVLCCEHRDDPRVWSENDVSFGRSLADFLSLAIEEEKRKEIEKSLNENQEKLRQSEYQLRLITENSSDGFVIMEDEKVTYLSPSYAKFMGYEPETLIGISSDQIFEVMHPDDKERAKEFIENNLKNKITSFKCEFRFRRKSGEYYWREDYANVIYDKNDKKSKYSKYIIISRDIHERKLIENKLIDSEQQLRLITENTSDGVLVIESGKLTYISPSYIKLLQYPKEYFENFTTEDIFNNFHPDDIKIVRPYIEYNLSKQNTELKYEFRFKDSRGQYHWREDSANVIYDKNGKSSKYIVITRDISARKEAEREKNRLYEITVKQNEKLIKFTHIVSHDIRSHTSNLSMILDLFEDTNDPNEQKEYFDMLKQSTNKLSDTIFYLNETVAVQSGEKNEKIKLNLKAEIKKAILGINAIILTNDAVINIEIDDEIEIIATQSYLESIIFNMLTNAIKYKSTTRNPIININAEIIENRTKLTIQDNGIGIDLIKNKDKVFGMYKTFHGNPDAVGLGLFMVKNHIESMGGRIEIESELDKGTTFNMYFV
ncbi:MAG: PAS domain-containing protein [Flavobacterium sp.]|uniref:PAS domain-containing protein n=1 Tax=Flavobacterium sp. TaxID=239 RepID=UPI0032671BF0